MTAPTLPRVLPSPSDRDGWSVETVAAIAGVPVPPHSNVHTRPQSDCPTCPPVACPCGVLGCPDGFEHRRAYAGSETTWRAVASC